MVASLSCTLLALVLSPAEDAAQAEAVAAEAVALHADGKLDQASDALARAHAIYPDRDYLYMRGVIEREAGHCDRAEELFTAFIAESPPLVDVEAAEAQLDKCAATLPRPAAAAKAQEEVEPAPAPVAEPPARPIGPPPARVDTIDAPLRRPWWKDRVGSALVGSGLAVAIGGGALLGSAAGRARAADRADTAGEYRDGLSVARGLNAAGFAAMGVATSLVISGIVHYVVFARRPVR